MKSRSVAVAALTAVTALTVSGCGFAVHFAAYRHSASVPEAHVAGVTALRVSADRGHVTVTTGGDGGVTIRRVVRYQSGTPHPGQQVSDGTLTFSAGCSRCSVDYDLVVPASVRLWVRTNSGKINLTGAAAVDAASDSGSVTVSRVPGAVNVHSDSGSLHLDDLSGTVSAASDSGSVHATGLRSRTVKASSDSGTIHLDFAAAPANVEANSDSGSLHLTVPGGPYAVNVRTDSGGKHINVPMLSTAAAKLDLKTDSGSVQVDPPS